MDVVPLVDEGLGNSAYVVDLGDGGALVVDPERDPRPSRSSAGETEPLARALNPLLFGDPGELGGLESGAQA